MKQTLNARAQKIGRAIRLTMSSMDSHIGYCYGKPYRKGENNAFHKKCVREYAEIIKILSELY